MGAKERCDMEGVDLKSGQRIRKSRREREEPRMEIGKLVK